MVSVPCEQVHVHVLPLVQPRELKVSPSFRFKSDLILKLPSQSLSDCLSLLPERYHHHELLQVNPQWQGDLLNFTNLLGVS